VSAPCREIDAIVVGTLTIRTIQSAIVGAAGFIIITL